MPPSGAASTPLHYISKHNSSYTHSVFHLSSFSEGNALPCFHQRLMPLRAQGSHPQSRVTHTSMITHIISHVAFLFLPPEALSDTFWMTNYKFVSLSWHLLCLPKACFNYLPGCSVDTSHWASDLIHYMLSSSIIPHLSIWIYHLPSCSLQKTESLFWDFSPP